MTYKLESHLAIIDINRAKVYEQYRHYLPDVDAVERITEKEAEAELKGAATDKLTDWIEVIYE